MRCKLKIINYISKKFYRASPNYTEEILDYINSKNYSSLTSYLIWVDTKNFKTNIFKSK